MKWWGACLSVLPSVCMSVCRVPRPNSRTERPNPKLACRMEAHHTGNPWTYLEVKRWKVKVTRPINADTDNALYAGRGITIFLKLACSTLTRWIHSAVIAAGVYGHFGIKTLRHRCRSVRTLRHYNLVPNCPGAEVSREHRCRCDDWLPQCAWCNRSDIVNNIYTISVVVICSNLRSHRGD